VNYEETLALRIIAVAPARRIVTPPHAHNSSSPSEETAS
jgi:hypothetical protein